MDIRTESPTFFDDAPGIGMTSLADGRSSGSTTVHVATLAPNSSLPRHPAGSAQVFYVVSGSGRVAGDDGAEHPVGAGSVVTWSRGEQHTSWADTEMTVVMVQTRHDTPPA